MYREYAKLCHASIFMVESAIQLAVAVVAAPIPKLCPLKLKVSNPHLVKADLRASTILPGKG